MDLVRIAVAVAAALAVTAVAIGLVSARNRRQARERSARWQARDAEMKRNTWLNATFRRNRHVKRITHRPPGG